MKRLRCDNCGSRFFTAAARAMVDRGERCSVCGGRLLIDDEHRFRRGIRVGGSEPDPRRPPTG